jgi:hypothetical protein
MQVEAPAQRLGQDSQSGEAFLPGVHVDILKHNNVDKTSPGLLK